jgi:cytochrome P450
MLHDETIFPDASEFKPERFISDDGAIRQDILDPEFFATFGYGRRFV